jgi:hypothetical protein
MFGFRGESLHRIVAEHVGQGRALDLDAYELLYRRKPDRTLMEGDVGPRDAAVDQELGELGLIAKDERRGQHVRCLASALSDGDIHQYLVPTGVIDRRPSGDRKASPWRERAPHLAEGGHAVRKIHERELADHDVKTRILERKRGRIASSPFHLRLSTRCDRQHPLIEIKANNLTPLPDPPKGLACEHAGPAANVEDLVTPPDSSGVGNRASPSAEDRRHEAGLIDLGSIR